MGVQSKFGRTKRSRRNSFFWTWLFNTLLFVGLALLFVNGNWFVVRARLYRETSIFANWVELIAACALLLLSASAVHEFGHLLAGRLAHLRFQALVVGPFHAWRAGTRLRYGLTKNFSLTNGLVASVPDDHHDLRRRLFIFTVGGPLASLMLALTAVALFLWLHDDLTVWRNAAWLIESAFITAVVSGYFFLSSIRIGSYLDGLPTDGERLVTLLRNGPEAARWCALVALNGANLAGQRPCLWNERLLRQALALPDGSHDDLIAQLLAYQWAVDSARLRLAERYLDKIIDSHRMWRIGGHDRYALEKAFILARYHAAATEARGWLDRVGSDTENNPLALRARAAVLLAEKRPDAAVAQAREAVALLRPQTSGVARAEIAWLEAIVAAAQDT